MIHFDQILKDFPSLGKKFFRVIVEHVYNLSRFYNQTVYINRIIGLIYSINLLKSSLILKFNTFIHNVTTFHFHSFHHTLMHLLDFCLVLRFFAVLLYRLRGSFKSCIQLKQSNTTTMSFFNQFQSTKHVASI